MSAVGGSALVLGNALSGRTLSRDATLKASGLRASSPRHGGTINFGVLGATAADTLTANSPDQWADNARVSNLYEQLATYSPTMAIETQLAEEIIPTSKAATSWLIRVRPGIEFHNGKTLAAEDVAYSLQRIVNHSLSANPLVSIADTKNIKVLDNLSLMVPMKMPVSVFDQIIAAYPEVAIVPAGYTDHNPVGTGPFKYESFTPGVQSVFVRNENYWGHPLPYVDQLNIYDCATDTAQVDGIESGKFNAITQVAPGAVAGVRSEGLKPTVTRGYSWYPITMRVDVAPFNDVRVRQAFRLIIDREKAMNLAVGSYGRVANDLFSPFDPSYNHELPQRQQDLDKAKSLLKAAGHSDLTVTMQTCVALGGGAYQTAQILAETASKIGVKVNLDVVTLTRFFGPDYLKWTFAQDEWSPYYYLPQVLYATLPTSDFNECHWDTPRYTMLAKEALSTVDAAQRADIVHEMQTIEWNDGAYIIPFFPGSVTFVAKDVQGMFTSDAACPFNSYSFKDLWIS